MATVKQINRRQPGKQGWISRTAAAAAIVLLAALAWYWQPLRAHATAGAAYGARVGCSCRYIAGRELADCEKDFLPGMGLIMLSEDEAEKSVTGWFPMLTSQTASYREGPGCVLESWGD